MLIRSQDRKVLLNLDNVTAFTLDGPGTEEDDSGKTVTAYMIDSSAYFIGTYSTEEKALEVLDEIAYHYDREKMAECYQTSSNFVYELPTDDDRWFQAIAAGRAEE